MTEVDIKPLVASDVVPPEPFESLTIPGTFEKTASLLFVAKMPFLNG